MPEFFEVSLMAAILRVSLIGRYISPNFVKHFVNSDKFPIDAVMLDAAFRRVEYVYATGKTVVIVLQHFEDEDAKCLLYQPLQFGFITVCHPELIDNCPISRGLVWQAKEVPDTVLDGEKISRAEDRAKGANVGFVVPLLGTAEVLRTTRVNALKWLSSRKHNFSPWWVTKEPVWQDADFAPLNFIRATGLEYELDAYLQQGNTNAHMWLFHIVCNLSCAYKYLNVRGIAADFVKQVRGYSMVGMTCGGYFLRDCNLECISSLPGRDPLSIILSTTGGQHDLLVEHLLKMRAKVQVLHPQCTLLECLVCTTSLHLARVRDVPKFYVYASCRIMWCLHNT